MTRHNRQLLANAASNLPGAALLIGGSASALMGYPDGVHLSELGIGYIGLLIAYRQAQGEARIMDAKRIDDISSKAAILRPQPDTIGSLISARFLHEVSTPEEWERARKIFDSVTNVRALKPDEERIYIRELKVGEKRVFGYPRNRHVFATNTSFICLDDEDQNLPDLVSASARGCTLQDEAGKLHPFLKPAAIRMALALGQYDDEITAINVWDLVYQESRGQQLLHDAYANISARLGGIVSDGPLALFGRDGFVFPFGDYRYLGTERLVDIETQKHAADVAHQIAQRGIYDVDKKQVVQLREYEITKLAQDLYENRHLFQRSAELVSEWVQEGKHLESPAAAPPQAALESEQAELAPEEIEEQVEVPEYTAARNR